MERELFVCLDECMSERVSEWKRDEWGIVDETIRSNSNEKLLPKHCARERERQSEKERKRSTNRLDSEAFVPILRWAQHTATSQATLVRKLTRNERLPRCQRMETQGQSGDWMLSFSLLSSIPLQIYVLITFRNSLWTLKVNNFIHFGTKGSKIIIRSPDFKSIFNKTNPKKFRNQWQLKKSHQ